MRPCTPTRPDRRTLRSLPLWIGLSLAAGCGSCDSGHEGEEAHDEEDHQPLLDEHPEGWVVLSSEQLESAGVEVVAVGPGEFHESITLAATVVPDADAVTHVNPRVPGLVRSVHAGLGDHVEAGELLCVIDSVELGDTVADYLQDAALFESATEALQRERELFTERLETTARVLDASIAANERILEQERGLREQELSTLRPLLEAEKDLEAARLERERSLVQLGAERDARLILLERQVREASIAERAARNRLRVLGVDADDKALLVEGSPLATGSYEIRAARAGIVMRRHITVGESVDLSTQLFALEDLSRVWVIASAFESQLAAIRSGSPVQVRLDAFPERVFPGTVDLVGYEIDPTSRSLPVRIEFENVAIDAWDEPFPVRPGMYGRVDIEVARRAVAVAVPESALVHEDEGDFVFVQVEPLAFERRRVETIEGAGELCEVLSGLEPGEPVVVRGTFLLKSAARSEELGGGHAH